MKVELTSSRRTFMKSAAIFSGLAALFGIVKPARAKPKEPSPEREQPSQGYRLTEHVKKYYETARL
jgi:hypothetical protein